MKLLQKLQLQAFITYYLYIINFQVKAGEIDWKPWVEMPAPEKAQIPCGYEKQMDTFRRLLMIRCWCPDRCLSQAKVYVTGNFFKELAIIM